jgi:hypothetical protein
MEAKALPHLFIKKKRAQLINRKPDENRYNKNTQRKQHTDQLEKATNTLNLHPPRTDNDNKITTPQETPH